MTHKIITFCIALVWIVNGLFCKILNLVPRHETIVSIVLSEQYARNITVTIGLLEIVMAFWILSRIKSKINAIVQIVIVISMNIIEFVVVPDLLLWGKLNLLFALIFSAIIYYNAYYLKSKNQ